MLEIKYKNILDNELKNTINAVFTEYALSCGISSKFQDFCFLDFDNSKLAGILSGYTCYKEVHVKNLAVIKDYRHKGIGLKLMQTLNDYFKDKPFENINLTTYAFQALDFYKKCGYKIEFIRRCQSDSRLDRYYLIKYLKEDEGLKVSF